MTDLSSEEVQGDASPPVFVPRFWGVQEEGLLQFLVHKLRCSKKSSLNFTTLCLEIPQDYKQLQRTCSSCHMKLWVDEEQTAAQAEDI